MNRFKRTDRVSSLIHKVISEIIENELRDKITSMVTVTGVEISKDLKYAKVFVTILGDDENVDSTLKSLNNSSGYIRGQLGKNIELRYTPSIKFIFDSSIITGMRINKILDDINKESD
jgi:ribosome-binding factor A